jgi:fumarate reductase subunit D
VGFFYFIGMNHSTGPKNNALLDIILNVLLPAMVLSYLSKDPDIVQKMGQSPKWWHLGAVNAMMIALIAPVSYGIWHFIQIKKINLFSSIGFISVLLTGGLTIYLWNGDGTVKPHAGWWFGVKEGSIPFALGIAALLSFRSSQPLIETFLYNSQLFEIQKIQHIITQHQLRDQHQKILWRATQLFAVSFFISTVLNIMLALFFFRKFQHTAQDALEQYNAIIGKITAWGFGVIGLPIIIFLIFTMRYLVRSLSQLTGLPEKDLLMPR